MSQRRRSGGSAILLLTIAFWAGATDLAAQSIPLNAAVRKRVSQVEKQLGLRIVWDEREIPACTWPLEFHPAQGETDRANLQRYLILLSEELSKYPKSFIQSSKLKVVAVGKGLTFRNQPRAALPDYVKETLYYSFDYLDKGSEDYVRHVVHHEYFHMLEEEWNGSAYFKDPAWARLNEEEFRYGSGGVNARNGNVSTLNHPRKGFINGYAMSGLEEDKAEVWAAMLVPAEWKLVASWCQKDERLKQKVELLERAARKKCRQMDDAYWERLRK